MTIGKAWKPKNVYSFGSLYLDFYSKYGGVPSGSIIQYYSPPEGEGSGKSSLGLCGLREIQKAGHKIGMVDVERTPVDENWLESIGIKVDKTWYYSRPATGEEALRDVELMVKQGCKGILFDSIDMARPKAYVDAKPGESTMGVMAMLMRKGFQDFKTLSEEHDVTFYLINQARSKMGDIYAKGESIQGGQGAYYYPTTSIRMRKGASSSLENAELIPITCQIKRSKLGGSWKKFQLHYIQGEGFDMYFDLFYLMKDLKIVTKKKLDKIAGYYLGEKYLGEDEVDSRNTLFEDIDSILPDLVMNHPEIAKMKGLQSL